MTATLETRDCIYRGWTVESIIRTRFGRNAVFTGSSDPNSPELGMIVTPVKGDNAARVAAVVLSMSGDHDPEVQDD